MSGLAKAAAKAVPEWDGTLSPLAELAVAVDNQRAARTAVAVAVSAARAAGVPWAAIGDLVGLDAPAARAWARRLEEREGVDVPRGTRPPRRELPDPVANFIRHQWGAGMPLLHIARALTEAGVPLPSGKPGTWEATQVRRWLAKHNLL